VLLNILVVFVELDVLTESNNPDGMDVSDVQFWNVPLNIDIVFVELDVLMLLNKFAGMDVMPVSLNVL